MSNKLSVELKNNLSEIGRIHQILDEFCSLNNLPPDILFALNLSLEEILTNVMFYGYDDSAEHQISVRIHHYEGELCIEIEDDGRPFNPLDVEGPDNDRPLEERPIGGHGIHLVRNYMDGLQYKRNGDKNLLIMTKITVGN